MLAVVERIEKRVAEKYPVKTLRVEIGRHESTVREANIEIQFVEDAVEICGIAFHFGGFLSIRKPFGVLGLEVVVGVAE